MRMTEITNNNLLGLDREELAHLMEGVGEPRFRGEQLLEAIYRQRVPTIERISTLPQMLRAKLNDAGVTVGLPSVEKRFLSQDGTVRYLMAFADGQSVETVWMPEGDGSETSDSESGDSDAGGAARDWERATICISSQVGCAVDCRFCLTALLGVKRNLTAGEIVGQVLAVLTDRKVSPPQERVNL